MANNRFKLLLVEDDANIQNFITGVLEAQDYQVLCAGSCVQAELMFGSYCPDLVILDLGLPDRDGMEFLKELRNSSLTPVIVLSARSDEQDKVSALDAGANDYVTKPFGSAELLARVRSALRNSRTADAGHTFILRDMTIDYDARQIFIGNQEVKLTQTEYNIVALLSQHSGKMMTYSAIIKAIWGYPDEGSIKKLQVNMANIRRKFGFKPGETSYITNEIGVGYRMNSGRD